ncbi:GNAT family N-acetyltransferase [Paenibacillus sp. GCM10027626]|uniref:GNAT family N-acetyltransferase n=1 Tax=Paenibacillus sp. GCM10027626 TaxID=3273411 RepID=UPI00362585FD
MIIRNATPADAATAIPLLFEAIGDISYILTGTGDATAAAAAMIELFQQPANRLSYENCTILEIDGRTAGALLAYDGSRLAELDQPLLDRIFSVTGQRPESFPQEALPGEYYLDSIAVDRTYRGQGLGKQLMRAFEEQAAARGCKKLSLIVELANENARQLYIAQGYEADGYKLEIAGHHYDHMVKQLTK